MITGTTLVKTLFTSLFRAKILGMLALSPDDSFYVHEIARQIGGGEGNVHRELSRLADAEIVLRAERDGNRVYYRINTAIPIYEELRSLLLKTVGLADVLKTALKPLVKDINLAFIYGSEAKGEATFASDIDLMIVGSVDELKLHKQIKEAEKKLNREINYSLMSAQEFTKKKKKDGFIAEITGGQVITLIGERDEIG